MSVIDRDLVDELLVETGRKEQRVRRLPARVVVYYVVALGLFFGEAYEEVMRRLVGGLAYLRAWSDDWAMPTTSALAQARARLGEEPLRRLFTEVCRPIATLSTPGGFYRQWRVMAMDGVLLDALDTPENNKEFTHTNSGRAPSAFPAMKILALAETGTRAIVGASIGTATDSENTLFDAMISSVEPGMLVTADRGLSSLKIFRSITSRGGVPLLRVGSMLRLDPVEDLDDGSYLSVMLPNQTQSRVRRRAYELGPRTPEGRAFLESHGTPCRVITYQVDTGDGPGEFIRLVTSILEPDDAPASDLAALYHERWEIELAFREIEVFQTGGRRVLRSKSPEMARQELWGILVAYYAIRRLMHEATINTALDPDRLSFIRSLRIIRRHASSVAGFPPSSTEETPSPHVERDD